MVESLTSALEKFGLVITGGQGKPESGFGRPLHRPIAIAPIHGFCNRFEGLNILRSGFGIGDHNRLGLQIGKGLEIPLIAG